MQFYFFRSSGPALLPTVHSMTRFLVLYGMRDVTGQQKTPQSVTLSISRRLFRTFWSCFQTVIFKCGAIKASSQISLTPDKLFFIYKICWWLGG